jgi:hypothetical protein
LNNLWTSEEDDILHAYYPTEGKRVIRRLPGRTLVAIRKRASEFNLPGPATLHGERLQARGDAEIERSTPTAAERRVGLPWLRLPNSAQACAEVAADIERIGFDAGLSEATRTMLTSVRSYALVLGQRLQDEAA